MEMGEGLCEDVVETMLSGVVGSVNMAETSDTAGFGFSRGFFTLLYECIMNTFVRTGGLSTRV